MEIEPCSAEYQSDGSATSQRTEHSSSGEHIKPLDDKLPEEIVLRADYSCYCTVCECTLSRIKDAVQHASGKRHKKACKTKSETANSSTKREAPEEELNDNAKKAKTEETEEDEETRKMLSKVFDETFHGGVVALRDNYYCKVCRCMIGNNRKNVNQHKEGKSHKMALEKFKQSLLSGKIDDAPVEDPNQPFEGDGYIEKSKNAKKKTTYYCRLCIFRTKEREAITEHMNSENHQLNVRIEKEREMMEQQGDYRRVHDDYYREGPEREMYPEEYYRETETDRFEQWDDSRDDFYYDREPPSRHGNDSRDDFYYDREPPSRHGEDYRDDYYYDREQPSHYGRPFEREPFNRRERPFRGGYQDDINDNMWNRHSENYMLHPEDHHQIPHIQNDPITYMPQPQQTPVPFIPPPHPAALPQSQYPQVTSTASDDLPGFITNESDAEVVIDVINSLLQTYLKYRIQALPGSFMKLLRKSSKNEESVTRINKLSTGKTAKQIFINIQNHKNKSQSMSTPNDESSSQPVTYNRGPSKTAEIESSPYHEKVPTRSLIGNQSEDSSSRKATEAGSSIDDVFQQYRSSFRQGKTLETTMQAKSSVTDFSKRYTISGNEDNSPGNECITNDLFERYRRPKKDTSPHSLMTNEPSSIDFSNRYRNPGVEDSSRDVQQNTQSVVDLFKRYRSSNVHSHN